MSKITVECVDIVKTFGTGDHKVEVLKKVSLIVYEKEIIMLMGPSGSGKSTLLTIIAGLLTQDSGTCIVLDRPINQLREKEKTEFRGKNIGFMFQSVKLIPTLTNEENVAIPLILQGAPRAVAIRKARDLVSSFGLEKDLSSYPGTLSGGELQRVAIARACIHKPKLILCDEPTSALDSERGKKIMDLLKKIKEEENATIIIVTHDPRILTYADKILVIEDGIVKEASGAMKAVCLPLEPK